MLTVLYNMEFLFIKCLEEKKGETTEQSLYTRCCKSGLKYLNANYIVKLYTISADSKQSLKISSNYCKNV